MNRVLFLIMVIIIVATAVGGMFVLFGRNPSYQGQQYEQPESTEMAYYSCVIDTDCALVQGTYCQTVTAVVKNREILWREEDAKLTEVARGPANLRTDAGGIFYDGKL